MSKIDDGGSAFPSEQKTLPDGTWDQTYQPGMSLRDWFAGQVINGTYAGDHSTSFATDAAEAYRQADAMLAARKEPSA